MQPPIIIAAFGTSSKARKIYERADAYFKTRFPDHTIHWAYTSRIVRHHLTRRGISVPAPDEVMAALADEGHPWAVVQSFNLICGHEFYRLVAEVQNANCRASIGHSLLCSPDDHQAVAQALSPVFAKDDQEAVVIVGHGTDHCIWTAYAAFYQLLEQLYGKRAFGTMIEEETIQREVFLKKIVNAGFRRVRLVPFMLVAGVHFEEDLAGPEDSWKTACEAQSLEVQLEPEGLGAKLPVLDVFGAHIQSAISAIPPV
jgi:sirohydrochlorin cobaltochelatase